MNLRERAGFGNLELKSEIPPFVGTQKTLAFPQILGLWQQAAYDPLESPLRIQAIGMDSTPQSVSTGIEEQFLV